MKTPTKAHIGLMLAWPPSTARAQPTGHWVPIDNGSSDLFAGGKLGHSFL